MSRKRSHEALAEPPRALHRRRPPGTWGPTPPPRGACGRWWRASPASASPRRTAPPSACSPTSPPGCASIYGPEFLSALMNEQPMGLLGTDTLVHKAEVRGVPVLGLDVNASGVACTVEKAPSPHPSGSASANGESGGGGGGDRRGGDAPGRAPRPRLHGRRTRGSDPRAGPQAELHGPFRGPRGFGGTLRRGAPNAGAARVVGCLRRAGGRTCRCQYHRAGGAGAAGAPEVAAGIGERAGARGSSAAAASLSGSSGSPRLGMRLVRGHPAGAAVGACRRRPVCVR